MKIIRRIFLLTFIFILLPYTLIITSCSSTQKSNSGSLKSYDEVKDKRHDEPNTEPLDYRFEGKIANRPFLIRWPMVKSTTELNSQVRDGIADLLAKEIQNPQKLVWLKTDTVVDSIQYSYVEDDLEAGYVFTTAKAYTNDDAVIYIFIQDPLAEGETNMED